MHSFSARARNLHAFSSDFGPNPILARHVRYHHSGAGGSFGAAAMKTEKAPKEQEARVPAFVSDVLNGRCRKPKTQMGAIDYLTPKQIAEGLTGHMFTDQKVVQKAVMIIAKLKDSDAAAAVLSNSVRLSPGQEQELARTISSPSDVRRVLKHRPDRGELLRMANPGLYGTAAGARFL